MDSIEARIAGLERQVRTLRVATGLSLASLLLAAYGFQTDQVRDNVRTHQLQVVDENGVPLVTLSKGRQGGASIVLRDGDGERRAWLTVDPNSAQLGLDSGDPETPSASVGLDVSANHAHLGILGEKASVSCSVDREKPSVELINSSGRSVFAAPWRAR